MLKTTIKLSNIDDVKDFSGIALEYPFEIKLHSGEYIINGKSIIGILSLQLAKPMELRAECAEDCEFVQRIEKYIQK